MIDIRGKTDRRSLAKLSTVSSIWSGIGNLYESVELELVQLSRFNVETWWNDLQMHLMRWESCEL